MTLAIISIQIAIENIPENSIKPLSPAVNGAKYGQVLPMATARSKEMTVPRNTHIISGP